MTFTMRTLRFHSPILQRGILGLASVVAAADITSGPLIQFSDLVCPSGRGGRLVRNAGPRRRICPRPSPLSTLIEQLLWHFALTPTSTFLTSTTAAALRRVLVLEGVRPICRVCKRIRTTWHQWQHLEAYLTEHSDASFGHGVCPDCLRRVHGNLLSS